MKLVTNCVWSLSIGHGLDWGRNVVVIRNRSRDLVVVVLLVRLVVVGRKVVSLVREVRVP